MPAEEIFALPHLYTPLPRITSRIQREVLRAIAREDKVELLQLEDVFANTRSALAHLIAGDRYRTFIEDKVDELVKMTRELLASPGVESLSKRRDWTRKVARATDNLEDSRVEGLLRSTATEADVIRFIRIIDAIQDVHVAEGYNPSGIISSNIYTMAHMVVSNFTDYNMLLNT